jgi:uncharacterized membrane protein YgcG
LDGTTVIGAPSLGYDVLTLDIKAPYSDSWIAEVGDTKKAPVPQTIVLKGPASDLQDGDKNYHFTLNYKQKTGWLVIDVAYVDEKGNDIIVQGHGSGKISLPADSSGNVYGFKVNGGKYIPPGDAWNTAVGYVFSKDTGYPGSYQHLLDFAEFDPKLEKAQEYKKLFIVYKAKTVRQVLEKYMYVSNKGEEPAELESFTYVPEGAADYVRGARHFKGKVPYRMEIINAGHSSGVYTLGGSDFGEGEGKIKPTDSQMYQFFAKIKNADVGAATEVIWYYQDEIAPGTGIPKDSGVKITKRLIGDRDGTNEDIDTVVIYSRKGIPVTITNDGSRTGDKEHLIADKSNPGDVWVFDTHAGKDESQTIEPSGDCEVGFMYQCLSEGAATVILTVQCSNGSDIFSSNKIRIVKDEETSVYAPAIQGYHLDRTRKENFSTGKMDGEFGFRNIELSQNGVYTFFYLKEAKVYVEAQENGKPISGYPKEYASGLVGSKVEVAAPVVQGYELSEPLGVYSKLHTIQDVSDEDPEDEKLKNTVVFNYEKCTGNVIITAVDADNPDHVIMVWSETIKVGQAFINPHREIAGWTPPLEFSPTVVLEHTNYITLRYTKKMADIIVRYYEKGSTKPVAEATALKAQVGSQIDVIASPKGIGSDWILNGQVYIHLDSVKEGENEVVFYYSKVSDPGTAKITILGYYGGTVIYHLDETRMTVGEWYGPVAAPVILGYKNGTWRNASDPVSGVMRASGVTVVFDFEVDTVAVPVFVKGKAGNALEGVAYENAGRMLYETLTAQRGADLTVYAPVFEQYLLDSPPRVEIDCVDGVKSATFVYKSINDIIPDDMTALIVIGRSVNGDELYRYEKAVPWDSEQMVEALHLTGYKLDGDSPVTVNVGKAPETVVFAYAALATTVTVNMVEKDSSAKIATSFVVGATEGSAFTYYAPMAPGYTLADGDVSGVVEQVEAGGTSELTFRYKKIMSKVTIIAKEQGSGRLLQVFEAIEPEIGVHDYPAPDLSGDYFSPVKPTVTINWDGVNPAEATVYYIKGLVDITVRKLDYITSAELGAPEVIKGQRMGEAATVTAPAVTGHSLVGGAAQTVLALDRSVLTFKYKAADDSEIVVNAVAKGENTILRSIIISAAPGESVFARAPEIPGWVLDGLLTVRTAVAGTDREIVFEYIRDFVNVAVHAENENKAPLAEPETIQVAKNSSHTVYAPHIAGYEIDGIHSKTFVNIETDAEVTFRYRKAASAAVLPTDGALSIYVTIASTGAPKPGAVVEITVNGTATEHTADARGMVPVPHAGFGTYSIKAVHAGYRSANAIVTLSDANPSHSVTLALAADEDTGGYGGAGSGGGNGGSGSNGGNGGSGNGGSNESGGGYGVGDGGFGISQSIKEAFETEEHIRYINGYNDGCVRPDGPITRAEVAAIIFRLLKKTEGYAIGGSRFADVGEGAWYARAVGYLSDMGIFRGYTDGTFKPDQSITRAEFASVVSYFDELVRGIDNPFSDVHDDYWASEYIVSSYLKGWISGYPGYMFMPDGAITRAEVVTIVNRILGRRLRLEDVPDELFGLYPDLPARHWAFADMIEASVGHSFERNPDISETWTGGRGTSG